jgi:SprB repeat/Secretion system C-terminal sorting domain
VSVPSSVDWKYYSSVPPIGSGGQDINSYWKLNFGGPTGWNCGIRYYYSIHEQAGLPDQSLNLGQRLSNGPWYYQPGSIGVNAGGKYFDKSGLSTIDEFTLGIQAPSIPFLITTTVTSGQGSALPSNSVSVLPLTDQTISFVGNGCYWVDSLFVDGNYVGNPSSYSFTAVQSNHQIVVKFRHALLPPVISIAQASGSYCPGSAIALTATTFLGGNSPVFQWYVNNLPTGTNSPNLTGTFQNGDVLKCIMTSNDSCAAWPMDTSNTYVVSQVDNVAPTAICNAYLLQLSPLGSATLLPQNVAPGSFDFCGIASTTLSQTSFSCTDAGTQNILVTVNDSSGNSANCTAVVTVAPSPISTTLVPVTNICGRQITCYGGSDGTVTAQPAGGCPPYTYLWSNGGNTATLANLTVGTYSVTVTDGAGGTSTAVVQMQQPIQPYIVVSQADSSCANDSTGAIAVLTTVSNNCQPPATLWTFPNGSLSSQQNLSGIGPGNYHLLVTDVLGCQDSTTVTIGSLPSPQPIITQNGNVLSTASGFASYQWLFFGVPIPGATGSSHTTTALGEYQVEVTASNGCTGTSTVYLLVGSLDPSMALPGLEVYPNPTRGSVRLSALEGIRGKVKVQLRNQVGQIVRTYELSDLMSPQELNLVGLSAGCYFLKVEDEKMRTKVLKLDIQ